MKGYVFVLVMIAALAGVQAGDDENRLKRDDQGQQTASNGTEKTTTKPSPAPSKPNVENGAVQNVQSWSVLILVFQLMLDLASTVYI